MCPCRNAPCCTVHGDRGGGGLFRPLPMTWRGRGRYGSSAEHKATTARLPAHPNSPRLEQPRCEGHPPSLTHRTCSSNAPYFVRPRPAHASAFDTPVRSSPWFQPISSYASNFQATRTRTRVRCRYSKLSTNRGARLSCTRCVPSRRCPFLYMPI